jgi:hypothetical protein
LPPAIHRQQALSAAWTNFTAQFCLTFGGHFIPAFAGRNIGISTVHIKNTKY